MDANTETAIKLIKHCHKGGAWGCFWHGQTKASRWYEVSKGGKLPTGTNWYFGIHPMQRIPPTSASGSTNPDAIRSQSAYIAGMNCFFAEYDGKDYGGKENALAHIRDLPVTPSLIIDSGGGYHCYHLFDVTVVTTEPAVRDFMALKQAEWVLWMGGDKGAKDLARVLRIPGTLNGKYEPARTVTVIDSNWELYEPSLLIDLVTAGTVDLRKSEALGRIGDNSVIESKPHRPVAGAAGGESIIAAFNRAHQPQDILSRNGYALTSAGNRFTRPGKDPRAGISGIVGESGDRVRVFTFSSNDGLFEESPNGHRHALDAFDTFVKLEHAGNRDDALAAAALEQGRNYAPKGNDERSIANILR